MNKYIVSIITNLKLTSRDRMALFEELMRVDLAAMEAESSERDEAVEDYVREARESPAKRRQGTWPASISLTGPDFVASRAVGEE